MTFDIRDHLEQLKPHPESKGAYLCPACGGGKLTYSKQTGAYSSHTCDCTNAEIREALSPACNPNTGLTQAEREERRQAAAAQREQQALETVRAYDAAAVRARRVWDAAVPLTEADPQLVADSYWTRKGLEAIADVRMVLEGEHRGAVLFAVRRSDGTLRSLQRCHPDSRKENFTGGEMKGGAGLIGDLTDAAVVAIAEGPATAGSIHQLTGWPVLIGFSTSGLPYAAAIARALAPNARLVFCADNDRSGAGEAAAAPLAQKYGAVVVMPPNRPDDRKTWDFNDMHQAEGDDVTRELLESALGAEPDAGNGDRPQQGTDAQPEPQGRPGGAAGAGEELSLEDAHQTLRQMVDDGAGDADIQAFINEQGTNGYGLRQFVDAVRQELQATEDARESVARLPGKGDEFEPTVAAYLPDQFHGLTRVLREGFGYPEPAIVMTILVAVTALLRPDIRVRALSFEQPCILWLFLIAGSGVGKTPLLKSLVLDPIQQGVLINLHESNRKRLEEWQQQTAIAHKAKKDPPPKPRRRNCIVTNTTTQGLRADMAANGADSPMFLVRDELSGWLKEMASAKDTTTDVSFFLSAYDGAYSNDVMADENRCREVKQGKLSVIGGIQPGVFEEYLPKGIENGFNTRPLFIHLPRVRKTVLPGDWGPLVGGLASLYEAAFEGRGLTPGAVYTPTPKAEAAFVEFFDDNETRGLEASSPAVDAIWQKANGQVLRVAAGLQFLRDHYQMEDLEPPSGDPLRPRISFDTMALAIQLVIAGKVTGVAIHERATNPQAALAARFMEKARELQPGHWYSLGEFAKSCWNSRNRPKRPALLELARGLHLAGQIQLSSDEKQFHLPSGTADA